MQQHFLILSILFFSSSILCQHEVTYDGNDIYLIPKNVPHTETLIYLHGVGASAQSMLDLFFSSESSMIALSSTKIVLLTAPFVPVTVWYGGADANSWFDILTFDVVTEDDIYNSFNHNDIVANSLTIQQVMREEINHLNGNSRRLFIGGFSQGCIMSLYSGLTFEQPIGGILGSSGYLVKIDQVHEANERVPMFLSHGKLDDIIHFELAEKIYSERLDSNKHRIEKVYEDGISHTVTASAQALAREWFFRQASLDGNKIQSFLVITVFLFMALFW